MAIDAVGNVGIGTTPTLTEKLTVNGNLKATSFLGNGATLDGIVKKAGDTITGLLTVQNTLKVTGGAITPAAGNSENAGIMFPKDPAGGGGDAAWIRYYPIVGEATVFEIGTSNDPDDRIALMAPGNVGIGTLTPSDKLDVAGNLRILTGSNPIRFTSSWSSFPDAVLNQAEICNDIGTYKTLMIVGNNSGGVGRRVSIWDRLEVNGRMSVSDGVIQKGGNPITNTADLGLYSQAAGYWMRFVTTGAGFWFFSDGGAGSNPIMTIDYTGNLTVGNSLYVNNLPFADRRNVQWDDRTKQFCYDNSSQRSKENITPLADEFTKLLAVEPKTYTRPDFPDTWEIGYIAEEFHDLGLDKLVYYNEDGSPGGINYPKIGLYLLEILKKHEQKFREYEEKIDRLEQQLSSS
jgi:Chaperone of endosialidase